MDTFELDMLLFIVKKEMDKVEKTNTHFYGLLWDLRTHILEVYAKSPFRPTGLASENEVALLNEIDDVLRYAKNEDTEFYSQLLNAKVACLKHIDEIEK